MLHLIKKEALRPRLILFRCQPPNRQDLKANRMLAKLAVLAFLPLKAIRLTINVLLMAELCTAGSIIAISCDNGLILHKFASRLCLNKKDFNSSSNR